MVPGPPNHQSRSGKTSQLAMQGLLGGTQSGVGCSPHGTCSQILPLSAPRVGPLPLNTGPCLTASREAALVAGLVVVWGVSSTLEGVGRGLCLLLPLSHLPSWDK